MKLPHIEIGYQSSGACRIGLSLRATVRGFHWLIDRVLETFLCCVCLMGRNIFQSFATLSGNGVTLIVDTQQLDKCNNNLSEENEALGKCRSKASESLSKHSSNSSSGPVSSSSATQSSSSDVVSTKHGFLTLESRGLRLTHFLICYWEVLITFRLYFFSTWY